MNISSYMFEKHDIFWYILVCLDQRKPIKFVVRGVTPPVHTLWDEKFQSQLWGEPCISNFFPPVQDSARHFDIGWFRFVISPECFFFNVGWCWMVLDLFLDDLGWFWFVMLAHAGSCWLPVKGRGQARRKSQGKGEGALMGLVSVRFFLWSGDQWWLKGCCRVMHRIHFKACRIMWTQRVSEVLSVKFAP